MPFTCAFDSGFSNGFEICPPTDTAQPDTRYLRGVPSAIPRIRKRPDVADLSGEGWVSVIGAGKLTGEAAISGDLLIESFGLGALVRELHRLLIAAIVTAGEAFITGEGALLAHAEIVHGARAVLSGERAGSGEGAIVMRGEGSLVRDTAIEGRLSIQAGGEAVLTGEENEEALILAAAMLIAKRLTQD